MTENMTDNLPSCWFLGEFTNTVDAQRRIAIPKNWRNNDNTRFFLLPGRQQSLQLVPAEAFQELLMKLRKVSFADPKAAMAMASIGSTALECKCDKQGRITLSPKLAAHADITNKAVLVGAVTTVQIWQPELWEQNRMDSEASLNVLQEIQERPDDFTQILQSSVGS